MKSSPAVVKSNQPATVQVSKKPKVQPTKAVLASLTTSSTQQPALPSRTAIAPSPMKSVEKVAMKSKSNLRTPHNSNTGRNPLSNQPHSLTQNPRTDHTSTSIVVLGGQFKARPMPNFKAIHGSKPTVLPRTVHTPTAAPITTTVPVASANIRPNTNTKPISTSKPLQTVSSHRMFSSSANKENKEKPAGNNIPSGPSRPVTVRKGNIYTYIYLYFGTYSVPQYSSLI